MSAYKLSVFDEGNPVPLETAAAERASEVLAKIPVLLARFPGCHRIRVESAIAHLFTVDGHGDRVED